ncbi:MAG: AEC family transporter [Clostridia bacterium]|nr:AEC family transporter [Clostridia bacterium]
MKVDVLILFHAVLRTSIPIAAGFIAAKLGMFDGDFSKKISALILKICQPVLIISSIMSVEYSRENLMTGLTVLLAALVAHVIMFGAAFGASRPIKNRKERAVSEYCMIFANAGFFGFPVVKSIYGDTGLFWGGFYYIVFNAALWSYGQFVFSRGSDSGKISWRKILLNAGTIPCVGGFILYLTRIRIYQPVFEAFRTLGDICTPISMMIIGAMLARTSLKKLLGTGSTWYTVALRLIVFPILCGLSVKLLGFGNDVSTFIVIMTSLPVATASAMFGETMDVMPDLAARNVGISTLLSIGTVPLTVWLASLIMNLF